MKGDRVSLKRNARSHHGPRSRQQCREVPLLRTGDAGHTTAHAVHGQGEEKEWKGGRNLENVVKENTEI